MTSKQYDFTEDWFSNNISRWNTHVKPKFHDKKVKALEIGSYEGRSACWLLDNVLTHQDAHITCIDHFDKNSQVKARFLKNVISKHPKKATLIEHDMSTALKELALQKSNKPLFDLIYIDLAQNSKVALEACILAFPLLKPQGMLIIDDYTHDHSHTNSCQRPGIDAFLNAYAQDVKVLETSWQVILLKRSKPLKRPLCKSEFYHENIKKI